MTTITGWRETGGRGRGLSIVAVTEELWFMRGRPRRIGRRLIVG
jgi:hypothetical protein